MVGRESSRELESNLAEVAVALFAPGAVDSTLQRIVDLALVTVDGCEVAGVFLVENERVISLAYSDSVVIALDQLQFETDEGPCLDAVCEGSMVYAEDLPVDGRWSRFGPAAAASGIRSVLSFRLSGQRPSALNFYSRLPAAFEATDRAKALTFVTVAGIALNSAMQRERDEIMAEKLRQGLLTRALIGQAQGILMERERISAEQAFDVLRQASQHLNVKLREVAQRLVDTGETPRTESGPRRLPSAATGSGAGDA